MNTTASNLFRSKKALVLASVAVTGSSTRSVRQQLRQMSGVADEVLRLLWNEASFSPALALLAVGGYGRESCSHIPTSMC